jgi:O-antigen/teichoic acid export membrane protein
LALALSIFVARGWGLAALGHYASVMAWLFPLGLLADFGLNTWLTREAAAQPEQRPHYLALVVRARWLVGASLVGGLWLAAPFLSPAAVVKQGLRTAAPMLAIDALFGTYSALWRAEGRPAPILALNLFLALGQAGGVALWSGRGGNLAGIFPLLTLVDAAQLGLAWVWWRGTHPPPAHRPPVPLTLGQILRQAWPFAVAGLLAGLQLRLLPLLLAWLSTAEEVGRYAVAGRFVEGARLPLFALFGALFPYFARLHTQPALLKRAFQRFGRGLALYGLAWALALTLFGGVLTGGIFGRDFQSSTGVLVLVAWGIPALVLRQGWIIRHYVVGREVAVNRILLLHLPVQCILGLMGIASAGALGAALAWLISESLLYIGLSRL